MKGEKALGLKSIRYNSNPTLLSMQNMSYNLSIILKNYMQVSIDYNSYNKVTKVEYSINSPAFSYSFESWEDLQNKYTELMRSAHE